MHTIDLEPYQYSGTNITGIRLVDPENPLMAHVTNFLAESKRESEEEESESRKMKFFVFIFRLCLKVNTQ